MHTSLFVDGSHNHAGRTWNIFLSMHLSTFVRISLLVSLCTIRSVCKLPVSTTKADGSIRSKSKGGINTPNPRSLYLNNRCSYVRLRLPVRYCQQLIRINECQPLSNILYCLLMARLARGSIHTSLPSYNTAQQSMSKPIITS